MMIPPPFPVFFLFYFFVQQPPPLSHIWHITLPRFFPISFFLFHFSALFLFFLGSTPVLFHFFGISDDSQPSSPHMLLCSFIFFFVSPFFAYYIRELSSWAIPIHLFPSQADEEKRKKRNIWENRHA